MPPDLKKITNLPVLDQEDEGTCLAFAASSVHECLHGLEEHLSPGYLFGIAWKNDPNLNGRNGLTMNALRIAISKLSGHVLEQAFPYPDWLSSGDFPNASKLNDKDHYYSDLELVSTDFDAIKVYLEKKIPVIIALTINDAFHHVDKEGFINEPGNLEKGGHAVVAVGALDNGNGKEFLIIRNSWGDSWGIDGYGLISADYYKNRIIEAAILTNGGINGSSN